MAGSSVPVGGLLRFFAAAAHPEHALQAEKLRDTCVSPSPDLKIHNPPGGRPTATAWGGLRTTEWYDESTDSWKAGPEMLHARAFFGLVTLTDGRLLAAGGDITGSSYSATAEIFDGSE